MILMRDYGTDLYSVRARSYRHGNDNQLTKGRRSRDTLKFGER